MKQKIVKKLHVKKGDQVMVLSGSYKGATGEVLEVFPKNYTAVVEGVNAHKKHTKPTQDQEGGITEINTPIHLSNLAIVDPKSGTPTRVGRKLVDGKLKRYSKKSGELL